MDFGNKKNIRKIASFEFTIFLGWTFFNFLAHCGGTLQKIFTIIHTKKFQVHLLWHQSKASGFLTIRPYSEAFEDSNLSIIDTVYIRKSARGHGFLSKFLEAKLNNDDSNELGFSDPISNSMLIVLMKLLKKNPNQRERIWLVNEENGERQILWWSAMKIARQRNIDLKSILK